MKKRSFLLTVLAVYSVFFAIFISCEIGLGASVDTEAPELEITSPETDAIIRDEFALGGTWSDDGTIKEIVVTVTRTDGKNSAFTYAAPFSGDGSGDWKVIINPKNDGILDGSYEATIAISDEGGHTITKTRTFVIDNTPPVVVLQRPGTKLSETPDAYGQTFSLQGQAADDNSISHIDIKFYSDPECTNLLTTITKSNVPPTISLDFANFADGQENDYSKIYGSTSKNGTQIRYCTITAYDDAKRYPVDASTSSSDDANGNSTSTYYLYDDISSSVLENYKITEVYKMFAGTYLLSGENRSATAVNTVKEVLAANKIEKSNFSLNPENNPRFIISGRDALKKDGSDFIGSENNISNGSQLVIEVSTGLDSIPLDAESLKVYALKCDANANAVADSSKIYPLTGNPEKNGSTYKFIVPMSNSKRKVAEGSDVFVIGQSYIFGVEGHDQNGNEVKGYNGGTYGVFFASSGAAPSLTISEPAGTITYQKKGDAQKISGTTIVEDGYPIVTITQEGLAEPIYTKDFGADDDYVAVESGKQYSFSFTPVYEEGKEYAFSITSYLSSLQTTVNKTVMYDVEGPEISINSLTPTAQKYVTDSTGDYLKDGYLNGDVTLVTSLADSFDIIDTTTNKPYFEIIDATTGKSIEFKADSDTTASTKHYITSPTRQSFVIHTKDLYNQTTGTTERAVKIKITAWDRAGNLSEKTSDSYIVDQTTDNPIIIPNSSAVNLSLSDESMLTAKGNAAINRFVSGGQLLLRLVDDDGINNVEVKRSWASENLNSAQQGSKDISYSLTLPTASGNQWMEITVTDANSVATKTGRFWVEVTAAAPVIRSITADPTYSQPGESVTNKIKINSTSHPFYVFKVTEAEDASLATGYVAASTNLPSSVDENSLASTDKYTYVGKYGTSDDGVTGDFIVGSDYILKDKVTAPEASEISYYIVYDKAFHSSNVESVVNIIDNTAPTTLTIDSPDNSYTGSKAISEGKFTFAGTAKDNDVGSGLYSYSYILTKSSTAPVADSKEWIEVVSSSANWSFTKKIGSEEGSLTEAKGWNLWVKAKDKAGNETSSDNYAHVIFDVDKSAPGLNASYTTVETGNIYKGNVTISGKAWDSNQLEKVTIEALESDGKSVKSWTKSDITAKTSPSEDNFTQTIKVSTANSSDTDYLKDGSYTIKITATDIVGKTSQTTKSLVIDTTKPTVGESVTVPNGYSFDGTSVTFSGTANDTEPSSGLSKIQLYYSNGTDSTATSYAKTDPVTAEGTSNWTYNQKVADLDNTVFGSQGTKYVNITAYDKAGNVSAVVTKEFVYDTAAPELSELAYTLDGSSAQNNIADGETSIGINKNAFTLSGKYSDTGSKVSVSVTKDSENQTSVKQTSDSSDTTGLSGSWSLSQKDLTNGNHKYVISATDASGRTTTRTITVLVDTEAPTVTLTALPGREDTKATSYTFRGSASDVTSGVSEVKIKVTSGSESVTKVVTGTDNWYYTMNFYDENWSKVFGTSGSPIQGTKTVTITASDKSGNTSTKFTSDGKEVGSTTFIFDTADPVLSVTTILGEYITGTSFEFNGARSDTNALGENNLKVIEKKYNDTSETFEETTASKGVVYVKGTTSPWTQKVPLGNASFANGDKYQYQFELTDAAGNTVKSAIYTTTVDTNAPQDVKIISPDGATGINAISESNYRFEGSYKDAESSVKALWYQIKAKDATAPTQVTSGATALVDSTWNGWTKGTAGTTSFNFYQAFKSGESDTSALGEGSYKVYVSAVDAAGNVSEIVNKDFDVDKSAPGLNASYTTVETGNIYKGNVTISGKAWDSNQLEKVTIEALESDGKSVKSWTKSDITAKTSPSEDNFTQTIKVSTANSSDTDYLKDGSYTIKITATDIVGKTSQTTKSLVIDTTKPTVGESVTVPNGYSFDGTSVTFSGTANDTEPSSGLSKIQLYYSNGTDSTATSYAKTDPVTAEGTSNWTYNQKVADLDNTVFGSQGTKYVNITAYDKAGNVSAVVTKEFVYDTAAPELSELAYTLDGSSAQNNIADGETSIGINKNAFTLSGKYSDTGSKVSVSVTKDSENQTSVKQTSDSSDTTGLSGSWSLSQKDLTNGNHKYVISATDASGRTTTRTITVLVDTEAPTVTLTALPGREDTKATSYTFRGSASDVTSGVSEVKIKVTSGSESVTKVVTGTDNWYYTMNFYDENWSKVFGTSGSPIQGTKTVTITASDKSGNTSTKFTSDGKEVGSTTFIFDTADPVLSVTTILGEYITGTSFEFNGARSDTNALGENNLKVIEKKYNDTSETFEETTASKGVVYVKGTTSPWTQKVPLGNASFANGDKYQYQFELTDAAGNTVKSAIYTTTVDTNAPQDVKIISPDGATGINAISESNYRFEGSYKDAESSVKALWYQIKAKDATAPTQVTSGATALVDSTWNGWTKGTAGTTSFNFYQAFKSGESDTSALGEGSYKVYVSAVDAAGNVSEIVNKDFDVDMSAPTIATKVGEESIESSETKTVSSSDKFGITYEITETNGRATENPTTITIKKDGTLLTAGTGTETKDYTISTSTSSTVDKTAYTVTITNPTDGLYTYEITAKDKVGKTSTVTRNIRLDTTAPTINIVTPDLSKDSYQNSTSITVKGNAEDATGTSAVYYNLLDNSENAPATVTSDALTDKNWTDKGWTKATGTTSWSFNITGKEGATKYLYIAAVDKNGNATSKLASPAYVRVDTANPTSSSDVSTLITNSTITLTGSVWDLNGIKSVTITQKDGSNQETLYSTSSDKETVPSITVTGSDTSASANLQVAVSDGTKATWTKSLTITSSRTGGKKDDELSDGTYTFTITVTDMAGKTTYATKTVTVDTTLPAGTFNTSSFSPAAVEVSDGSTKTNWYTKNAIKFNLSVTETNLSTVEGTSLAGSDTTTDYKTTTNYVSFSKTGTGTDAAYAGIISGLAEGANTIWVKMTDLAGNVNYVSTAVNVDTIAPAELKVYDESGNLITGEVLVNGKSDYVIYAETLDAHTGIKSVNLGNSYNDSALVTSAETGETNKGRYKITISKDAIKTGNVNITATDGAGNSTYFSPFAFTLDNKAPEITLTSPTASQIKDGLYGTVEVSGTVTDKRTESSTMSDGQLASIKVYYSLEDKDEKTWLQFSEKDDSVTTTNSKDTFVSSHKLSSPTELISIDSGALKLASDSTNRTKSVWIKVEAQDKAGNTSTKTEQLTLDRDLDRPEIQLSSVNLSGMSSTSRASSSSKTIYGNVVDTDGVKKFEYKVDDATSSNTTTVDQDWTEVTLSGGGFTINLPSDGKKNISFRVTDNNGGVFETSSGENYSLSAPKIKDAETTPSKFGYADSTTKSTLVYLMVDTSDPAVMKTGFKRKSDGEWMNDSISSQTFGGPADQENNTFHLRQYAYDKNGIESVKAILEKKDGDTDSLTYEIAMEATSNTDTSNSNTYTEYETKTAFDVSGMASGTRKLSIITTDTSKRTNQTDFDLVIDNTAPSITINGPSSDTTSSGSITAYGTTEGASKVYYAISTMGYDSNNGTSYSPDGNAEVTSWTDATENSTSITNIRTLKDTTENAYYQYKEITDASISWFVYFDSDTKATSGTHVQKMTDYLVQYGITDNATTFDSIVKLYIWIKAVDSVGNVKEICTPILLDPQGDRPTISYSYPSVNGSTLGGEIKIYGSVNDPAALNAENLGVKQVWVQLISEKHELSSYTGRTGFGNFEKDDTTKAISSFSPTKDDLDYLKTAGYTLYNVETYNYSSGATNTEYSGSLAEGTDASDYAIPATLTSTSWSLSINTKKEFDIASGTNGVAIRVFAVDGDKKKSITADRYVEFDASNPVLSNLYLIQSSTSAIASATDYNATASKEYSDDMFVKGEWYLVGTLTDNDAIKSLKINGNSLIKNGEKVTGDGWDVLAVGNSTSKSVTDEDNAASTSTKNCYQTWHFKYKLSTVSGVGSLSFNIEAVDLASPTPGTTTKPISVNYDNQAPDLADTEDSAYNIQPSIKQDNGFYTFGSKVSETVVGSSSQSGLDYIAFFFMRRNIADENNEVDTIYNPMLRSGNSTAISTSVSEISGSETDDTIVYDSGLYWKAKTVTRNASSLNVLGVATDSNMRVNGLVKIGGVNYKIIAKDKTSVTINGSPEASFTKAYFAYAMLVDNKVQENGGSAVYGAAGTNPGYPVSIANDDGDGMVEYIKTSGSNYTWSCDIVSRNIPDGPIEIHYVAFDQAGNYSIGVMGNWTKDNFVSSTYKTQTIDRTKIAAILGGTDTSANALYVDGASGKSYYKSGTSAAVETSITRDSNLKNAAFIANNAPRLAGVKIWTDYNSDDKESEEELSTYYYNSGEVIIGGKVERRAKGVTSTLIVSDNGKDYNDDIPGTAYMTIRDKTTFTPEIVGGNGELQYQSRIATAATLNAGTKSYSMCTALTDSDNTKLSGSDMADKADYMDTTLSYVDTSKTKKGKIEFTNFAGLGENGLYWFDYKIWDSTEGTICGTNSLSAVMRIALKVDYFDDTKPTATINPFHWTKSGCPSDDSDLYNSVAWDDNGNALGHIELEADLTDAIKNTTVDSTALGDDPKVSGKIIIDGYATDNIRLKELYVSFADHSDLKSYKLGTSYSSGTWSTQGNLDTDGWSMTAKDVYANSEGHKAHWMLTVDTSKVTDVAALDKAVRVFAVDERGTVTDTSTISGTTIKGNTSVSTATTQTTSETPTAYYKMDVVPYITGVKSSLSKQKKANSSVYDRTAKGHYPVNSTETIYVSGFNLSGGKLYDSASSQQTADLTAVTDITSLAWYSSTAVPSGSVYSVGSIANFTSGNVSVKVNSIESLNNLNNNSGYGSAYETAPTIDSTGTEYKKANFYNRQPNNDSNNLLTDDVVLDVWQFNSSAAKPISGIITDPVMKISPSSGMIGFAFTNGPLYFSMPGYVARNSRNSNADGEYSYFYWQGSYDFMSSVGLAYDSNGYTYGCAAGGDINSTSADRFSFMTSRWGVSGEATKGSYDGSRANRLEAIGQINSSGVLDFDKNRIKSPSYATSYMSDKSTNVYLAYYDNMNGEIRFRAGNISSTSKGNFGNFKDAYRNNNMANGNNENFGYYTSALCQIVANSNGTGLGYSGEYVSLGVIPKGSTGGQTDNDTVVMVWYDSTNSSLMYAYNTAPVTGTTGVNTTNWSAATKLLEDAGEYCQVAVDAAGGIHIAAYDGTNADLKYVYIDKYTNAANAKSCTVDSYAIVGQNITIDVAYNGTYYVPYIGYYALSNNRPKYAKLVTKEVSDGVGSADDYTGVWEVSVIPTTSKTFQDRVNIGVWKDTSGKIKNSVTGTSSSSQYYGKCYGNGTANPVLGYAIKPSSSSGFIETAQMK